MKRKKSLEFILRPAREGDVNAILEITLRAWKGFTVWERYEERYGKICNITWEEKKKNEIMQMCKNLDNVIVAESAGKVIGYASFYDVAFKTGEIGSNAVDPEFQGMGVGTALIERMIEIFKEKGLYLVRVSTLEDDIPARRVYEKNGFEKIVKSVHYAQVLSGFKRSV